MINTTDLTSYYPGYDDYCEPKDIKKEYEYADEFYEEKIIEKELEKMKREIIDLNTTNMTFEEITDLKDYVWKNDKLIPIEIIEGE